MAATQKPVAEKRSPPGKDNLAQPHGMFQFIIARMPAPLLFILLLLLLVPMALSATGVLLQLNVGKLIEQAIDRQYQVGPTKEEIKGIVDKAVARNAVSYKDFASEFTSFKDLVAKAVAANNTTINEIRRKVDTTAAMSARARLDQAGNRKRDTKLQGSLGSLQRQLDKQDAVLAALDRKFVRVRLWACSHSRKIKYKTDLVCN